MLEAVPIRPVVIAGSAHEKLPVYARALAAAILLDAIARQLPPRRPDLVDQLFRASASIVLNIAEGAGEFSPADKSRFYRIARRSAGECSAILDLAEGICAVDVAAAKRALLEVRAMLTALVLSIEKRRR